MQVLITDEAQRDIQSMRDRRARAKIYKALDKLEMGNPGVSEPVGEGLSEIKLYYGPGYRIYYFRDDQTTYVVACAGDKSTQSEDIKRAKEIKQSWK